MLFYVIYLAGAAKVGSKQMIYHFDDFNFANPSLRRYQIPPSSDTVNFFNLRKTEFACKNNWN